jgi:DNA-binding transcriptional ArsR family regulator
MLIGPAEFLRIAVDPIRLAILGQAAIGPVNADELADALGEDRRRVIREIGRLVETGLLSREYTLDREALRLVARAFPQAAPADAAFLNGPWSEEEARQLAQFFSGSRLVDIPANRGKRRLVLERLAQEFEPGLRYDERAVNSMLQVFHSDHTTLRRYLVDEGFLTRAEGVYWRTGGRVGPPSESRE